MDWAHSHLLRSVDPTRSVQGSPDGSAIESPLFAVTMDDTAAAPQHWLFAGSALPDRRSGDTEESTHRAAGSSANGQMNTQSGNNDHADDPLPAGSPGNPAVDQVTGDESVGNHHTDDPLLGGCPRNLFGDPNHLFLGSWTNHESGTDPNCQPCPHVDFPDFLKNLIECFVGRLNDQNHSNNTSSGNDRLEAALAQLVQALAGEFSDCAGFDPGSSSSASGDPMPHTTIAATWHHQ
jgi:hypothetical protein